MGLWGYFWWGLQNNLEKQHASTRACLLNPRTCWVPLITSLVSSPRKAVGSLERLFLGKNCNCQEERKGALKRDHTGGISFYIQRSSRAAEDRKSLCPLSTAPFITFCLSRGMTSVGLTQRTECLLLQSQEINIKGFVRPVHVAHEVGTDSNSKNGTITLATEICCWIRVGDFTGCQRGAKTSMP